MRKILLFAFSVTLLTACDNLKTKEKTSGDQEENVSSKKKRVLDDEQTTEDETPRRQKRTVAADDEESTETPVNNADTEDAAGWSSTEKRQFMEKCVEGVVESFGQRKADSYCSCMLRKIERRYPNAVDAAAMTQEDMVPLAQSCVQ